MNRRLLGGLALALVALIVAGAIGTVAYREGVIRGLAEAGRLPAPDAGPGPLPYYGDSPFWHHGPFAFGVFGFLFPLLGVVLIIGLLRALFWGPWCLRPHGSSRTGVPPRFEEWHRRAHDSMQERGQNA